MAPYQAGNSGFINATNGKSGDIANQGAQETIKASTVKADAPTMSLPQMMELAMKNVKLTPLKCKMLLLIVTLNLKWGLDLLFYYFLCNFLTYQELFL